ncbi:MAG TPA: hypothetical protein VH987_04875 [Candidatus Limnocylindria bacterium]
MARRGGKAANRHARRKGQRGGQRSSAPATRAPEADLGSAAPASSGAMDAFERADAEVRAAAAPPMSSVTRRPKGRAADPRITVVGSSRLGERAAAEYHYVQRDLRNIGVLLVVLAVLLAIATIAVNVLGIGRV